MGPVNQSTQVLVDARTYSVMSVRNGGMGHVWLLEQTFDYPFDPIYRKRIAVKTFDFVKDEQAVERELNIWVSLDERAEPIIARLLNSNEFQLSDEERGVLSGELQKIRRQRPSRQRTADRPKGFTQVYCCANCGRLHNSVSMPCPHCDWSPQTLEEMARSIMLSNSHFRVPALLILSREIAKGRVAVDVVPDLLGDGNYYLSDQESRQAIEKVFSLLQQNEHENHRRISMIRACSNCGEGIVVSTAEECEKCGVTVNWPEALRLLACMDNLLWLLERRVEPKSTDAFSDLVCVLVAMIDNLLRKQEVPSIRDRQYSLQLLTEIGAICDLNSGAVIDTSNPRHLEIYLIKDSMREDSKTFGLAIFLELEFFVAKMADGVRH
jgi:hypothetical protein